MDELPLSAPPSWKRRFIFGALVVVWLGGAVAGLTVLWRYENTPGTPAASSTSWPSNTRLVRSSGQPTLVVLAHPQCTCTRATLTELGEILARAEAKPRTYVLFLKPIGFADGWEMSDLWERASRLPGATVLRDDEGAEARVFGAMTSGQTLLYDGNGELMFSGGITGARGHAGENAGRNAVVAALNGGTPDRSESWVFGCSLFSLGA
jgi:hypothetical protein